jgi:hypothetical protein
VRAEVLAEQLLGAMGVVVVAISERMTFVRAGDRVEHSGMHAGGVV